MKKLLILFIFILATSYANACILKRFGKDCPPRENKGNQVNVYNGGYGSYADSVRSSDGAESRKRNAGDKSKNQGYSEYKEHFIFYAYEVWSAPHQNGFHKSSETSNRSIAYEYAFNPYISFKAQKTELFFNGLSSNSGMKQDHILALLNLRLYLLNDFVVRAGAGIGRSKIVASGSEDKIYNYTKEGSTEVVQFSAMYIFGDENTFLGVTTTTIQGLSGDNNLGSSSYGLNAGIGF